MFWYEKVDKNVVPSKKELKETFWLAYVVYIILVFLMAMAALVSTVYLFSIGVIVFLAFLAMEYSRIMDKTKYTYTEYYGKKRRR